MSEHHLHGDDSHDIEYKDRPLTMGAMGMWLPIALSILGLTIVIVTSVGGIVISNASRITKVETLVEAQQAVNVQNSAELKRLNDQLYQTRDDISRQRQRDSNGQGTR